MFNRFMRVRETVFPVRGVTRIMLIENIYRIRSPWQLYALK